MKFKYMVKITYKDGLEKEELIKDSPTAALAARDNLLFYANCDKILNIAVIDLDSHDIKLYFENKDLNF